MKELSQEVIAEFLKLLDEATVKVRHCLDQLEETDIWWKVNEHSNSIGNILLHLSGNLRQWVVAGIGGAEDHRERQKEFEPDVQLSKAEISKLFFDSAEQAKAIITNLDPDSLNEERRIQGFDVNVLRALFVTVPHAGLHAGQVLYITKAIKGADYQLSWKPKNKEQGL